MGDDTQTRVDEGAPGGLYSDPYIHKQLDQLAQENFNKYIPIAIESTGNFF